MLGIFVSVISKDKNDTMNFENITIIIVIINIVVIVSELEDLHKTMYDRVLWRERFNVVWATGPI